MKKLILVFVFVLLLPLAAAAQGNAFNFQGRLNDGTNPANGSYDLQFKLFNAITGGTQIGATIARPNIALINGVFSVNLDFGGTAFNNPDSVFIEIGVRPIGSQNAYTILGPRQQLTVVPYAIRSSNSTFADVATNAINATNAQTAINAQNALTLISIPGAEFVTRTNGGADFIRNSTTTQTNSNFNISGNGVINGNLNVGGNTVNAGNIAQNRDKNGLVKAMLYVDQLGNIVRCYNGVTGSSIGGCGFTVVHGTVLQGQYTVDFGFRVDDRFISVTPGSSSSVTITAGFSFNTGSPNKIFISTNITDVDHVDSYTNDDFMIIVY